MLLDLGDDMAEQFGRPIECVRVLVAAVHIIYHAVPVPVSYEEIYALSPLAYINTLTPQPHLYHNESYIIIND